MKKRVLIIAMCVVQTVVGFAQTPNQIPYPSTDTLPCGERQRNYFYSEWHDTVDFYLRPDNYNFSAAVGTDDFICLERTTNEVPGLINWKQQFAPRRIRIKGLWAMVQTDVNGRNIRDSTRLPEYLYIGLRAKDWPQPSHSCSDFLLPIDSVRWDTAQPKMMCVKQTADGRKHNMYCHVYEALFDTVYTLSGEFWLGGSFNSNRFDASMVCYEHWPTIYVHPSQFGPLVYGPSMPYSYICKYYYYNGMYGSYEKWPAYSPFGVILDEQQYYVELPSADTVRGIAKPTAYYPAGSYQTITAVANHCYKFSHWSDGDTTNPRTILVTQDTSFTAYFDTVANTYSVAARSNNPEMGWAKLREWPIRPAYVPIDTTPPNYDSFLFPFYRVIGTDTVYCEGDSAIFWAKPYPGAYFWNWNDGVRENPRTLTVTQDTMLTAIFKNEVPPTYKRPCPRVSKKPLVVVMDTGHVLLTWGWGANFWTHESWELAWGLAGTPPDSCQIIPCHNFDMEFSNLEAGVRYVAYVRALCNKNDMELYSDWSDSVEIYFPYFPHRYTVTVAADYAERGRVYGGGEYDEGDVAMLTANAWTPYSFLQWNDGDTANPRYIVVTQDTSFTALFSEPEPPIGIAAVDSLERLTLLLPNPAKEKVSVLSGIGLTGVDVFDAQGRQMLSLSAEGNAIELDISQWPSGSYVVRVHTQRGTASKRLIVGN